jgi:hypothetical protein
MGTLLALLAQAALAYQPTLNPMGAETAWDRMPVRWTYDDEGRPNEVSEDAARAAARAAFGAWNGVAGAKVNFIEVPTALDDEVNVVGWQPEWRWDEDILALTTTWSTEDGEIQGFRVLLNATHPEWTTTGHADKIDVQNTLTHEVGHALGLGHDEDHPEATMAPTANEGEVRKRDLHRSDEDGARYLYPGEGGATCHVAGHTLSGWGLALLALAPVLYRRRTS